MPKYCAAKDSSARLLDIYKDKITKSGSNTDTSQLNEDLGSDIDNITNANKDHDNNNDNSRDNSNDIKNNQDDRIADYSNTVVFEGFGF